MCSTAVNSDPLRSHDAFVAFVSVVVDVRVHRHCRVRNARNDAILLVARLLHRYQGIYPLQRVRGRWLKFIRDVDHHARACWWSTSENSEKCPRVMRGNMSVPSDYSFSTHLCGSCAEFVATLWHRGDGRQYSMMSEPIEVDRSRSDVCIHDAHVEVSTVANRCVREGGYDLMSAVKTTMLER